VNETIAQDGDLDQMIWKVPEMIAYLLPYSELAAGMLWLRKSRG
jgi:fumarylpyruvate hydrolase